MVEICYWPNGVWCYRHELEQMSYMSDDFSRISIPEDLSEDQIDEYVEWALKK